MADQVTLFVRSGDPHSEVARRYLDDRGVEYTLRDVVSDPSAGAILMSKVGQLVAPAFLIGDKLLVGFDPVQLARFLPRPEDENERVTFGAGVRSVSAELAQQRGLPATYGVEVGPVKPESAAAAADVREGDIVTDIGGFTLYGGADQFQAAVAARHRGDVMKLTLWRDGGTVAAEVRFPIPEPAG